MYPTASSPQYAFGSGLAPVPMPVYKRGGEVKETYGLDNIAEMLRQRGREGDTVLAHISPQEAGILQLLGGSGTINPYTGLPEFKNPFKKIIPKPIYKLGSSIGKAVERGVESIAKNEILGPIAQMAAAYFGGPIGAGIYAGLAKPGSSFDVKNAAKAAALTYAGQQISQGLGQAGTPMGEAGGIGAEGASMSSLPYGAGDYAAQQAIDAGTAGFAGSPIYQPSSIGAVESAVSSAGSAPIAYTPPTPDSYFGGADAINQYASAPMNAPVTDSGLGSLSTEVSTPTAPDMSAFEGGVTERGGSNLMENYRGEPGAGPTTASGQTSPDTRSALRQGYDSVKQGYNAAVDTVERGIKNVIPEPIQDAYGATRDFVKDLIPPDYRETLSTVKDIALIGSGATTAYGMYQTKKELEDAKREADRILGDQANRKKEEIEWAQGVLRDYPYNYQRLTEENVRRERGMAMGGRINSYDDEMGGDDGMMQGGIAALAKGGLPPRYLRGGGDGMSDSIKASIEGKQEARLADGEFVVPADVVSHLGNGSSNAGAKKLYSMMDRVRRSRTGKTRQAPEVNTRRLMPA
jgi:hypothetical protein